jgi:hypothetical protein
MDSQHRAQLPKPMHKEEDPGQDQTDSEMAYTAADDWVHNMPKNRQSPRRHFGNIPAEDSGPTAQVWS